MRSTHRVSCLTGSVPQRYRRSYTCTTHSRGSDLIESLHGKHHLTEGNEKLSTNLPQKITQKLYKTHKINKILTQNSTSKQQQSFL